MTADRRILKNAFLFKSYFGLVQVYQTKVAQHIIVSFYFYPLQLCTAQLQQTSEQKKKSLNWPWNSCKEPWRAVPKSFSCFILRKKNNYFTGKNTMGLAKCLGKVWQCLFLNKTYFQVRTWKAQVTWKYIYLKYWKYWKLENIYFQEFVEFLAESCWR